MLALVAIGVRRVWDVSWAMFNMMFWMVYYGLASRTLRNIIFDKDSISPKWFSWIFEHKHLETLGILKIENLKTLTALHTAKTWHVWHLWNIDTLKNINFENPENFETLENSEDLENLKFLEILKSMKPLDTLKALNTLTTMNTSSTLTTLKALIFSACVLPLICWERVCVCVGGGHPRQLPLLY